MMNPEPSRVTPAEVCELLALARRLPFDAPLDDQIDFHLRKALLLSRIAADLNTPEAYMASAEAWQQAARLCRQRDRGGEAAR